MYYENTYRVEARDADPFNQCRPSSLLNILQEAATRAAIEGHTSRWEMAERYGCFWMLARLWYRLDKPLYWDDPVTVRTWHRPAKGVSLYRDFDLFRNGEPVGEAVTTWVLAGLEGRKLLPMNQADELKGTDGGELCKALRLRKIRLPAQLSAGEARTLYYSECDVNGHVNNVHYADFACDAIHLEREGEGKFVSSLQLSFLKECRPGETITLSTGQEDGVWYVLGSGGANEERFRAALTLKELPL